MVDEISPDAQASPTGPLPAASAARAGPVHVERLAPRRRIATPGSSGGHAPEAIDLLRAVVAHSPDTIATVSCEGSFLFMNRRRADQPPLREGATIFDALRPEDHARVRAVLERVAQTRTAASYDATIDTPDGATLHFETRVGPIVEDDEVVALALVSTDVTVRRRQARALHESQEHLRFAMEASGMGIWTYEVANDHLHVDAHLGSMTGITPGTRRIAELADQVPPADRRAIADALRRCIETGVYPDLEHRILRGDGRVLWLHSKGRAVRDAEGAVTQVIGGSFDVTAQVEEAERRDRAQKLEAVGQLAAGVAHNFNNALASMQLNLEVAIRRCPEDVRPLLRDALEAGQRGAELVRELLRFAGRGSRGDVRELEGLDAVATRVASLCRHTFPADVALHVTIAAGVPRMPIAVAQVEQVILNLCINAQHALEEVTREPRWVRLSVDVVPGDAAEVQREDVPRAPSFVRLRVADNGAGMTEGTMARMFEPFFTTKVPGRGTGLGLATTWSTARDHGGWVTCESQLDQGTTFSVYFPVRGRGLEVEAAALDGDRAPW